MPKGSANRKKEVGHVATKKELMSRIRQSEDIEEVLRYTTHEDDDVRLEAVKLLCPCKCEADVPEFWVRVFNMVEDPDHRIRDRVLHIICDGSPSRVEEQMAEALEKFNRDPDSTIRRKAHKVRTHYERTGKWNIM